MVNPVLSYLAPDFPQRLTPSAVRLLRLGRRHRFITKAKTELGYTPTTVERPAAKRINFSHAAVPSIPRTSVVSSRRDTPRDPV